MVAERFEKHPVAGGMKPPVCNEFSPFVCVHQPGCNGYIHVPPYTGARRAFLVVRK